MSFEIQPYFAEGERHPALIGVRAEGDEYETAYVSKSELVDALAENDRLRELVADMWFWHYEGHIDSESQERQMLHIDAVIQRMRELGVEVDAWR